MSWPVADPAFVAEATVTMVVQVNGKVKSRLDVSPSITEEEATVVALADAQVVAALGGLAVFRWRRRPAEE